MATTKQRINPLDGPVSVYYKAWETANGNFPVSDGVLTVTEWTELGSSWQSPDGLTIDITSATDVIKPAGFDSPYARNIVSGEISIKVNMEKADLEEMEMSIGNSDYFTRITLDSELSIGTYAHAEMLSLCLVGYSDSGTQLVVYADCVVPGDSASFNFKREQTQVPFEWVCLQRDKDLPFFRICELT